MIEPYKIIVPDERLTAIRAKVQAYDWDQLSDARWLAFWRWAS
jgi:hypothetical protein